MDRTRQVLVHARTPGGVLPFQVRLRALRLAPLALTVLLLLVSRTGRAEAGLTERCMADHERAQMLAQQSRYLEASALALSCAQPECPGLLRRDCAQLYGELQRSLSSLVLAVRDRAGHDLVAVHVEANGRPLVEQVDGRAIQIDPGVYKLRFEVPGYRAVERDVTLRKTEKDRLISVELTPLTEPLALASASPAQPLRARASVLTPGVLARGALGVAGLALATGFGVAGKREYRQLERRCEHACTDDQVAPVRRSYIIANTAVAVGAAGLVSALVLYWLRARQAERASALGFELAPLRAGALGAVHARF